MNLISQESVVQYLSPIASDAIPAYTPVKSIGNSFELAFVYSSYDI